MGEELLEERKTKIFSYFKGYPFIFVYIVLGLIAAFGFYVRTRSLGFLIDVTTGDYMPSDPDAIGILRYVQYVVDHGQLMAIDTMRYFPTGFANVDEFSVLVHLIAWFYKIFHFFVPSASVAYADVIYPAFAFVVGLVFFFLFVRKIFDWKIALLACIFSLHFLLRKNYGKVFCLVSLQEFLSELYGVFGVVLFLFHLQ